MVRLRVSCKFLSSFHVSPSGQDAASEAHHCRNTNVVGNWVPDKADYKSINENKRTFNLDSGDTYFL